jgi:hypothetical protein
MGHGGTGGYRGSAPQPRRDLGPAIPPPRTVGEEADGGRPGFVRDQRKDRRRSRPAPGLSANRPQTAVATDRSPTRGPAGLGAGQGADPTSSAPSKRPSTPGGGVPTTPDPDTTGTCPADPPDERPATNTAPHPPRTPPHHIHLRCARSPTRLPGTRATSRAAGHARSDAQSGSCQTLRPAQQLRCRSRVSE